MNLKPFLILLVIILNAFWCGKYRSYLNHHLMTNIWEKSVSIFSISFLIQLYLLLKFPYVPFDALPDPADDVVLWSWSWAELVVSVVSCRGRKSISVIPILLLWQGRRNLIKISLFQKFSSSQIQWRSDKKLWQFEFFVFLPEQNRSTVVSLDFFFERLLGFF